jgi:predicted NAD/FAD-dependent oxidoreductase
MNRLSTLLQKLAVFTLLLLASFSALAQTNAGRDFWLAQTPNVNASTINNAGFTLMIANPGSSPAVVTISNPSRQAVVKTINPASLETINFTSENANIQSTGTYVNNVYHVTSPQLVVVFSFTPLQNVVSNDAALIYPVNALGKKHFVGSYNSTVGNGFNSFYGVVATQDGSTLVKVYDRNGILKDAFSLIKGQYYQRMNGGTVAGNPTATLNNDVTGWYVEADKAIAVFSGNQASAVGQSKTAADHLDEQVLPLETLAKVYVAAPTNSRPIGCLTGNCSEDIFRYVATEDNTVITTVPDLGSATLNKGQFLEVSTNIPHIVSGTKPFYGYQFLVSQNSGVPVAATGDPSMMSMPVIDQFQVNYTFLVPNSFQNNFINLVAPTGTIISLNGSVLSLNWINVGVVNGVSYQTAKYQLSSGVYNIAGSKKFGINISGFDFTASYAYMGGSGLEPINAGCMTGGPYQAFSCSTSNPVCIKLTGKPSCSDNSMPQILWTSPDGVVFSDATVKDPIATVPGAGTYNITLTVNCGGNITSCSSEIIVREPLQGCSNITPPSLTPPPSIVLPSDDNVGYVSNVNLEQNGSATYSAAGPVTLITNAPATFPIGTTIVTWTLTDVNGITTSGTQNVTVAPPPSIVAPDDITVVNNAGDAFATINNIGTPISYWVYNNYSAPLNTGNATGNYNIGSTAIIWTIADQWGRVASDTQYITVTSAPPTIIAPAPITVTAAYNGFATIPTLGTPTTTVSVNFATVTSGALAIYPIGTTTVTWTVTDGIGRTASDVQQVVVIAPRPVIAPAADITISNDPGVTYSSNMVLIDPVFSAVGPYTLTNDAPANGHFPIGTTVVTWTLTDVYGNIVTTTNKVIVVSAPPTIVAPAPITVTAGYNGFASIANLGTPTTTVSVNPATVTNAGSLAQYPIGSTIITWTVTDGLGRTASDVQKVIVVVPQPTIAPPADLTVSNDPGETYATGVNLGTPTVQAVGPFTLTNDAPANGQWPLGTTTITWTLTDAYGNVVKTTQKVTVVSAPPTLTPPANITVTAAAGQTSATIATIGTATYTVSVNPATLINSGNASGVYPVGTTTVTWTVKDGLGRTASGTQTITVNPSASCSFVSSVTSVPTDVTPTGGNPKNLYIGYGAQSTKLQVNVPNTGGPYTFQWTGTKLSSNTSATPIFTPGTAAGNYTFTVAVKNASGCTSTATISICVRDVRSLDKNGNWDGKKVIVCHLPPGNIQNVQYIDVSINAVPTHVPNHGGDGLGNTCEQPSCTSPYARGTAPVIATFGVNLYPNPTANQFSLTVKSDDKYTDINIRIIDAFGRTVEVIKSVTAGRTVLFGDKYANGTYFAEVVQGSDKKMIPMVKAK